jgi:drug/metabolite transporter (DMT)-like permease
MGDSSSAAFLGPFCAFLASVTWALGSAGYGRLSRAYSPFAINFARASVALPLYLLVCGFSGASGLLAVRAWHVQWLLLSILSSYVIADVLFFMSIRSLGLPSSLAIASTYPLWSALVGWWFRGEHLHAGVIAGLVGIVGGTIAVILATPVAATLDIGPRPRWDRRGFGVGLAMATSLLWALNAYSIAQVGNGLSTSTLSAVRMTLAVVLCPLVGSLLHGPKSVFLVRSAFLRSLPIFVIESFGGSYFFAYGLSNAPLGVATSLSSLSPVIAVPIALMAGWERPSGLRIGGVLAVVGGVILLLLS